MSFLNLTVWQALVLLGASAAAIVGLYLLKPPPRKLVVSSTMLWSRVLKEKKSRTDRWRWWLSLLAALAIGLSIALAVSRPEIRILHGEHRRIAVVMDNTPTMAALSSDGRTRWEKAVELAEEVLRQGSPGSEFLVADTTGAVVTATFSDRNAARQTLQSLPLAPSGQGKFPALDIQGAELFFISDGVLIDPAEVPTKAHLLSVFEPTDNVGITGFVIRSQPANRDRFEAFLEIANASTSPKAVSIQLSGTGGRRLSRTADLDAGKTAGEIFDLTGFQAGAIRATVTAPGDSLDADNVAFSYLPLRRALRVVLVTPANLYLETLLRLDPKIQYIRVGPEEADNLPAADVTIYDRHTPSEPPVRPSLLINASDATWLALDDENASLGAIEWDKGHPILQSVNLQDLAIDRMRSIDSDKGRVVVENSRGPLIVAVEAPVRHVQVGFALEESNFPLQPGFPIFFANVMAWLAGVPQAISRSVGTVEVPVADARITSLDGASVATTVAHGSTYFEALDSGLYTAVKERERLYVAVNLADSGITELNRSGFADTESPRRFASSTQSSGEQRGQDELWILLLSFAVVLILLEWWSYHRRMTI